MGRYARKLIFYCFAIAPLAVGCGVADGTFGDIQDDFDRPYDSRGDDSESLDATADEVHDQGCGPGEADVGSAAESDGAGGGAAGTNLKPGWSW